MRVDLPLAQKRIVVTRAEEQSDFLASQLEKLGARAIILPTIRIEPSQLSPADVERISNFGNYDVVIFTSRNAVENVRSHVDLKKRPDGKPFVVAIGKKTAESIVERGLTPDLTPQKFNSDELMKSLRAFDWKNKRVLIPKGNLAGSDVPDSIRVGGGTVDEVVVYSTLPNNSFSEELKTLIVSGEFDAVVFFSPSQIKNFIGIFGAPVLDGKEIAVIGPTTKKAAENVGIKVDVMPENSTTESLIASMVEYEKS